MNFGVNLYNWFLTNAQSLVLMAIVVIGIYLGFHIWDSALECRWQSSSMRATYVCSMMHTV